MARSNRFWGDGEDPLDELGVRRLPQGGEAEQGVHCHQAGVASAHAVVTFVLEVIEEGADERSVEIDQVELAGCLAGALRGEAEQESERVPVGGDGVGAHSPLGDEALAEERLEQRGEAAHGSTPSRRSRRSAADARSSGLPDRYQ